MSGSWGAVLAVTMLSVTAARAGSDDPVLARISQEGLTHSQVMDRALDTGRRNPADAALDLEMRFYKDRTTGSDVLADLPGKGPEPEVVMVGAHLDSWHAGTGATDNGAGVVALLEAARQSRTHHTTLDTLEYVRPDDLKQAAVVTASFLYQAATRAEPFPRD